MLNNIRVFPLEGGGVLMMPCDAPFAISQPQPYVHGATMSEQDERSQNDRETMLRAAASIAKEWEEKWERKARAS
jgi:hypothetical protein